MWLAEIFVEDLYQIEEVSSITSLLNYFFPKYYFLDNLCADLKCENCPLYNSFCMSCDTEDEKANSVKKRIEKFLNGTD